MLDENLVENDCFRSFLFLCLLQEEDTDPGDHEDYDARVNGKGNVNCEQQSPQNRGDHSASETYKVRLEQTHTSS